MQCTRVFLSLFPFVVLALAAPTTDGIVKRTPFNYSPDLPGFKKVTRGELTDDAPVFYRREELTDDAPVFYRRGDLTDDAPVFYHRGELTDDAPVFYRREQAN